MSRMWACLSPLFGSSMIILVTQGFEKRETFSPLPVVLVVVTHVTIVHLLFVQTVSNNTSRYFFIG